MTNRNMTMPPHAPSPEEATSAVFFIKWWAEILGGTITILMGLFLRAKGRGTETSIIPMSEEEIEHRLTICKQSILLALHEELNERDEKLFRHVEEQDEKMLEHIKDIIDK